MRIQMIERVGVDVTYPQNLNLSFDLGHADVIVDASAADELDSDLLAPIGVQAQLDFAKLTLAQGLQKEIRAEFGNLATRVGGGVSDGGGMLVDVDICGGRRLLGGSRR